VTEGPFTEADLAPSAEDRARAKKAIVEKAATSVAVLAVGLWMGGLVALGACAAPFVFRLTPAPYSGDAMGAAFARFDSIALGAAVVTLAAEIARTWAAGTRGRTGLARVRRTLAIALACAAAYVALSLTPRILAMHRAGITRGDADLDAVHARAELVGKLELGGGLVLVALHVFTLGTRRPDEDEESDDRDPTPGPLPPGPRG
jgi:Domain of unknown function (DUF4149)